MAHLRSGGRLFRCDETLLTYRYHENCETFSVDEKTIWDLRIKYFQENVMSVLGSGGGVCDAGGGGGAAAAEEAAESKSAAEATAGWTIWNAGKQGRRFYRSLLPENRRKIAAFCDVDVKKLASGCYTYEESDERPKPKV